MNELLEALKRASKECNSNFSVGVTQQGGFEIKIYDKYFNSASLIDSDSDEERIIREIDFLTKVKLSWDEDKF